MLSSLSHRRRAASLPIDRHVAIYKPPAREEFAIAKKTHIESMRLLIEQLCAPGRDRRYSYSMREAGVSDL